MTRALRASYGAKDNMHTLLAWEGPSQPPDVLLGLTDKPGILAPGERWWPSVGCGPVEPWWALWWTRPDEQATRGGMVRSEVALWRLDEVGSVKDLLPMMLCLGGEASVLSPPEALLAAAAEALLAPGGRIPVVSDLSIWPGTIAALWSRLWPAARKAFSARVAVTPPQGGESVAPPWIFGVPASRAQQWADHPRLAATSDVPASSRAGRWFIGSDDPVFTEVFSGCSPGSTGLGFLDDVARAADRLERLRASPTPRHALDVLRTVTVLAPSIAAAPALKREALAGLTQGLAGADAGLVQSLANLDLTKFPDASGLPDEVAAWTDRHFADLPAADAARMLERLASDQSLEWWRRAVSESLSRRLAAPDPHWARAAFSWLAYPDTRAALATLLPATEAVEERILDAASGNHLNAAALANLRAQAIEREWSRLHAWVVMRTLSPHRALRAQRTFPGPPSGLALLAERLAGDVLVSEVIADPEPQWTDLVARRTAREPALLTAVDARQPAWRALWRAHVAAGGAPWPPGADRQELANVLLDAASAGDDCNSLIAVLADELAESALLHPRRAALWSVLSASARAALLPRVVDSLIRRCNAGHAIQTPEPVLTQALLERLQRDPPSARVLAMLLGWDVPLNEPDALRWLRPLPSAELTPVAQSIGAAVLARRWAEAAEELYRWSWTSPGLRPAAEACRSLLSRWSQIGFSYLWDRLVPPDAKAGLVARVAELAADLFPDELDDLWVRAGGERKRLKSGGWPHSRWLDAARQADQGALADGLAGLVRELLASRPFNEDLKQLAELLSRQARR